MTFARMVSSSRRDDSENVISVLNRVGQTLKNNNADSIGTRVTVSAIVEGLALTRGA